MKYPCGLIQDLLPLYHDKVCGEESSEAVQEHLEECAACKKYYDTMCESDVVEEMTFDEEVEQKKAASLKKVKKKWFWKLLMIILALVIVWPILLMVVVGGLLVVDIRNSEIGEYTDITQYERYIGRNAKGEFQSKWNLNEEIFPETITDDMQVKDFKMVYYNPWDAQYLAYLTVQYDEAAYAEELERLKAYKSTDYIGNYSVTGPPEGYSLLAMEADDYYGFIYAFTDDESTITYVELIFCNHFYDLEYTQYIPQEYLPAGFDATVDNPYRKQQMSRDSQALENIVEQYEEDLNLK
ncbi:MAG: zf-HC2 domain-containing protein [Lachnospiraceae bacterium]|nr:zf-HC2 domain-containing protein [Lachnospiraceae bacterium]